MDTNFGILAIVPAVLVIALALKTKQTLPSLIIGAFVGCVILSGYNPLKAFPNLISEYVIPAISGNAGMLMLTGAAGGFIYMIKSSGAAQALGNFAARHIKSRKGAQTCTFFAAFAFLYTEPHLTLGVIMRPITERFNVSRVKLAYMCDSLATIASISPICACGPYISSLIAVQLGLLAIDANPWPIYLRYIPYNFYAIFAILTVLIVVRTGLDVGPMYTAEQRAIRTGKLIGPNDKPIIEEDPREMMVPEGASLSLKNIVIPLATLFGTLFAVIFWTGDLIHNGLMQSFLNAQITLAVTCAMLAGSAAVGIVACFSRVYTPAIAFSKWTKGIMEIMSVNIILIMAWTLGGILNGLGVKEYMAALVSDTGFPPALLPALVFLLGALTSFATGSSWGTWAILIPIVFPIAYSFDIPGEMIVGAVISGGLFGDHCSPISDTTIMSSTVSACDHVEHVRTQLPYGLTVGLSAFIGFIAAGLTKSLVPGLLTTLIIIMVGITFLNRMAKRHIQNDPEFMEVG